MAETLTQLTAIDAFEGVPIEQLEWLLEHSKVIAYATDAFIFKKRDPVDTMYIILQGEVEIKLEQAGSFKVVDVVGPNEITGFLPYSRATTSMSYSQCTEATVVLQFPKELMKQLAMQHYELTQALVHKMTTRTRALTTSTLQNEKLMALGKLSAGLAHELNNPTSAMLRNAVELKAQLGQVPEKFQRVMTMRATEAQVTLINDLVFSKITTKPAPLSVVELSEREDEMDDFLSEHQVKEAYKIAEVLIDFGFDIADMQGIQKATKENFPTALEWIENVLTTERLVSEINESATRISDLVTSIKSYSHMDRSHQKQHSSLVEGIRSTLTMLNHKIKAKQITVSLQLAEDLIKPKVIIGEINQVWTNILDNAIDAVGPKGNIVIEGRNSKDKVIVRISDDGSGIPAENLSKIFDPFFTTKEIGKGTGLGLDVSYRIIKQHMGNITVSSDAEGTTFEVTLPLD